MRTSSTRASAIALLLGCWALPVSALSEAEINASDINRNGLIDQGRRAGSPACATESADICSENESWAFFDR